MPVRSAKPLSKAMTKIELFAAIARDTGLTTRRVAAVFNSLTGLIRVPPVFASIRHKASGFLRSATPRDATAP